MIVCVEGPNGAGKTRGVELAQTILSAHYEHFSHCPPEEVITRALSGLTRAAKYDFVVWDRFHIPSDLVYNELVTGVPTRFAADLPAWISLLRHFEMCFVYVTASIPTLIERTASRGEDYVKQNMVEAEYWNYERFFSNDWFPTMKIETTNQTVAETSLEVVKAISHFYNIRGRYEMWRK